MQISTENIINKGMSFSTAIDNFKLNHNKNIFESIITKDTILEDDNLNDDEKKSLISILNSEMNPFEKRLRIMRALDKEKEFSSKIALTLKKRLGRMDMVEEIMRIFRDSYIKSDVLKKDFGEVLTPFWMVKDMISEIEVDFWKSPYNEDGSIKRILETSNGSGIFLWTVIFMFMKGLKNSKGLEKEDDRYKFILENMIYACELQNSKMHNWLCTADLFDKYDMNVYCGSYLDEGFDNHMKDVWVVEKFSLTLSNPPYQENIDGNNRARPIYNLFTEKSINISDKVLFITPSRWLAGGFGLDEFRKMMFDRTDIKLIKHFDDATKIFGNSVEIKGGVSYFLIDKEYNGLINFDNKMSKLNKYDIFVDIKYHNLLDRIISDNNLTTITKSKSFWMNFNDKELDLEKNYNNVLCYVSKSKGLKKFITLDKLTNSSKKSLNRFKVYTPYASGSGTDLGNFGNKIIGYPNEVCSNTYMTLLTNSERESISLISYMNTKFCNFFLSLRKNTQNMKPDTLKWIPMIPFDREWTDEQLFEYFNLTDEEQKLILG